MAKHTKIKISEPTYTKLVLVLPGSDKWIHCLFEILFCLSRLFDLIVSSQGEFIPTLVAVDNFPHCR